MKDHEYLLKIKHLNMDLTFHEWKYVIMTIVELGFFRIGLVTLLGFHRGALLNELVN